MVIHSIHLMLTTTIYTIMDSITLNNGEATEGKPQKREDKYPRYISHIKSYTLKTWKQWQQHQKLVNQKR